MCVLTCEKGRHGHTTKACLQTHTNFITVCHALCSPLWLELMLTLRKLLTVFTLVLKAEAGDYVKGRYMTWLVVFGQSQCTRSVGQSKQTVLVGRRGFVENEAFERGGA